MRLVATISLALKCAGWRLGAVPADAWSIVLAFGGPVMAALALAAVALPIAHATQPQPQRTPVMAIRIALPAPASGEPGPSTAVELVTLPVPVIEVVVSELPPPAVPPESADDYLCAVYGRLSVRRDGAGDFTWKDPAAAKRAGMDVCRYVIGGMDPDFRDVLHAFGKAADAHGFAWSILSGFRDDYRQRIASGFKASVGHSLHGGSKATCGYGCGRAADLTTVLAGDVATFLAFVDRVGRRFGLVRPMKASDPAHVQAADDWRQRAAAVRRGDAMSVHADAKPAKSSKVKTKRRLAARIP